ncbi:hypothetical protein BFJ63_vAg14916 [Fusarium oxysporum f. sp. narcissi]|uniref:DNA/RNA-binding domain-containing protein n=1 Tax=Fusarium oxysporum f. sp. narcissi TaxID=451672 RepID=A0A4Q2VBH6_FUSOX|nr:hypothetical protein BFJ63_vAg14916 [Fusarium oxysporum f. sp. narcissi]
MARASDSEARTICSQDQKPLYVPERLFPPVLSFNKSKRETDFDHQETLGSEIRRDHPANRRRCLPTCAERTSEMMRLPEARPIPHEWLVAEANGIYAGLVRVETECIQVDNAQLSNTDANSRLNDKQWQILIELHRTLLHEHHDFFLVIQHPSATPVMREVASQYSMPGRMWRHGIHSFLELLRQRLPSSLEHMLAFLSLAYGMMTLLYETVLDFQDTWIECLGDLGRYRMAIEDSDNTEREIWRGVSRRWYSMASDESPTTGRLYHHHAILARQNPLQQLYYYIKSLCVPIPFSSTRESMMALYYIAISLSCSLLGYGSESNVLMRAISKRPEGTDAAVDRGMTPEAIPDESFKLSLDFAKRTITAVIRRSSYDNTLSFAYSILVFMNHLTRHPAAMFHLGNSYPWKETADMLNVLLLSYNHGYDGQRYFRLWRKDQVLRPLPEDFAMRGLPYSADHFPDRWFRNGNMDEDERNLELPSHSEERKVRILSLGWRIATLNEWLIWDEDTQLFSASKGQGVEPCQHTGADKRPNHD